MTGRAKNRVAWAGGWHSVHNNQRYEELLPRLANVDRFSVRLSRFWPLRGMQRRIWLPLLVRWLGWRYPLLFCTDWRQIRMTRTRVVCDLDDPVFSAPEIAALSRLNVEAIVVTTELVRRNLRAAGVCNPIEIIPQGVGIGPIDRERVRAIRQRYSPDPEEILVGLHQPHFDFASELSAGTAEQMYAVEPLFAAMKIAQEKNPRLVLWLVGRPSAGVAAFAAQHPWVRLIGYQPHAALMEYVSGFDIGVYPRTLDLKGRSSIKVLEYMACGVPVVGFKVDEMRIASEADAGVAVANIDSFAEVLATLAEDRTRRERMGANGKRAAQPFNWDLISETYRNLLDRYSGSVSGKRGIPK
jgi:glycosyltransferase involved in cell wall biosynthesis